MSKLRTISAGLLIIAMAILFLTRYCYSATYYKYVDKNGTVCFTDSRQSIPEEYKGKATKITIEKENADKKSGEAQIKTGAADDPSTEKKQELPFKEKIKDALTALTNSNFFRPGIAIAIFIILFILIGKIGVSLGHKQLSSVLRIALTAGILVFLIHAHMEKIANAFNSLIKDATDIAKRAEERSKKAGDAAKDPLEPENPRK